MAAPVLDSTSSQADQLPARRLATAGRRLRRAEVALARPRLLVALLAVYVPFFVVYFASPIAFSLPHAAAACHGQPILDQRWGYTSQQVAAYLQACGGAGRAAISAQQAADLVYPALFAAVLTVGLALLLRAAHVPDRRWAHVLVLLPAFSAAADYLENAGIRTLLATFPRQPAIVPAVSAVTTVKLATGWMGMGVVVVLACVAGFRWVRVQVTRRDARGRGLRGLVPPGGAAGTGRPRPAGPRPR